MDENFEDEGYIYIDIKNTWIVANNFKVTVNAIIRNFVFCSKI